MSELIISTIQTLASILSPLMPFLVIMILIIVILFIIKRSKYMKSEYYATTKIPYFTAIFNKGSYGEYLIYKYLMRLAGTKKFLFNCYIPKDDGSTSEIDVILLHTSGIYVFESKNYSGWIFGTDTKKMWTQTFRNGKKVSFFNPVMQNNTHIKWLKRFLPEINESAYYSIIVFSERCELKKLNISTNLHRIIKRDCILSVVSETANQQALSDERIEHIYQKLYPHTQISEETRTAHNIAVSIKSKMKASVHKSDTVAVLSEAKMIQNNEESEEYEMKNFCSKCGFEMVMRVASKGERKGKQFWGCPNYPKCRNTINVN